MALTLYCKLSCLVSPIPLGDTTHVSLGNYLLFSCPDIGFHPAPSAVGTASWFQFQRRTPDLSLQKVGLSQSGLLLALTPGKDLIFLLLIPACPQFFSLLAPSLLYASTNPAPRRTPDFPMQGQPLNSLESCKQINFVLSPCVSPFQRRQLKCTDLQPPPPVAAHTQTAMLQVDLTAGGTYSYLGQSCRPWTSLMLTLQQGTLHLHASQTNPPFLKAAATT